MFKIILMTISASIVLILGIFHLIYTFWGKKLTPRSQVVQESMDQVSPWITKETTMWRAWIGFNASHSMGAILFGLVYSYLAVVHTEVLFNSEFMVSIGFAMLIGYLVLGKLYWFRIPFMGIIISLICYSASIIISFF